MVTDTLPQAASSMIANPATVKEQTNRAFQSLAFSLGQCHSHLGYGTAEGMRLSPAQLAELHVRQAMIGTRFKDHSAAVAAYIEGYNAGIDEENPY